MPNGTVKEKRTNSLAFSRTDCHTCTSSSRPCDRRRPQCSTCLELGLQCGGFATPLSWDSSRIWLGQPSQKSRCVCDDMAEGESPKASSRAFRFVSTNPRRKKRRRTSAILSPAEESRRRSESPPDAYEDSYLANPSNSLFDNFADPLILDNNSLLESPAPHPEQLQLGWIPPEIPAEESQELTISPVQVPSNNPGNGPSDIFAQGLMELLESVSTRSFDAQPVEPIRLMLSPIHRSSPVTTIESIPSQLGSQTNLERLFQMYDRELCVLPLTSDVALNPFRFRRQALHGSRLLFHATLALCCQHQHHLTGTWSQEASEHREKASELLERASQSNQITRTGLHILDPILVMFTLDCTLSATGPWHRHLKRVRTVLDACGGPRALDNSRVRSQVGMLIWWDATLALISRQGIIIDQSYLDQLKRTQEQDEWSFFDLTGCPGDLFSYLVQLAELAKQREIAACMTWLNFDLSPVLKIEQDIQSWQNIIFADGCGPNFAFTIEDEPDATEADIEERFHSKQDRYHCTEAWRYALLIYIERVFRWDRKCPRSIVLKWLVRKTLDHVRCCRRTSQTQKQLLLPVFLAGSETVDLEMRRFARNYCQWWATRSRYNMFNSVSSLLEEIWGEDSADTWWGSIIDRKTAYGAAGEAAIQFLFG